MARVHCGQCGQPHGPEVSCQTQAKRIAAENNRADRLIRPGCLPRWAWKRKSR